MGYRRGFLLKGSGHSGHLGHSLDTPALDRTKLTISIISSDGLEHTVHRNELSCRDQWKN